MRNEAFLAVDWGTTNRRVYRIAAGRRVEATERDDRGLVAVAPGAFATEAAAIRARFGDLPMLCAGMVGSVSGWAEAPYVDCPASLGSLAERLHWVEPGRTAIVPGVRVVTADRSDVMRGEEVQILGAAAAGSVPADALVCQPGTHCKWARLAAGRIAGFTTAMTGELFAMLRRDSLLAPFLDGEVRDGPAFRAGVRASAGIALLSALFGARADVVLGRRPRAQTAAYVSGLLIGSDVAAHASPPGEPVHLLADPVLGELYGAAIEETGGTTVRVDGHAAFVAGIVAIWEQHHAVAIA